MHRLLQEKTLLWVALSVAVVCIQPGCSQPSEPSEGPDPAPFEVAIAEYLDRGNMAMVVKRIKQGPSVSGNTASLKASLTRAVVGGPSVTWTFNFKKTPDGTWEVVNHQT